MTFPVPEHVANWIRRPVDLPLPAPAALGGAYRARVEDFFVEEIPAYRHSGRGPHRYLFVEKRDLTTPAMVGKLAETLGIRADAIGIAGRKDARAITRQWISIPESCAHRLENRELPVTILESDRHDQKLRTGELAGNRFRVVVRNATNPEATSEFESFELPAYFGRQRFGARVDTHQNGLSLLRGSARKKPSRQTRFILNAAQAALFNAYLAIRVANHEWQTPLAGDVFERKASRTPFFGSDEAAADAFARGLVRITGPLFGPAMPSARGQALAYEQAVLDAADLKASSFELHRRATPGSRRPLAMVVNDFKSRPLGASNVELSFRLEPGMYASTVLESLKVALAANSMHAPAGDEPRRKIL